MKHLIGFLGNLLLTIVCFYATYRIYLGATTNRIAILAGVMATLLNLYFTWRQIKDWVISKMRGKERSAREKLIEAEGEASNPLAVPGKKHAKSAKKVPDAYPLNKKDAEEVKKLVEDVLHPKKNKKTRKSNKGKTK